MNVISDAAIPCLVSKARVKWDETREKHLLLFPEGLLVLNPTAHDVLALCDGQRAVVEIVKTLSEQYQTNAVAVDVRDLLTRLRDKGLLVFKD